MGGSAVGSTFGGKRVRVREASSQRLLRAAMTAALCVALAVLGGCSALRLGYNQADWVAFRWLDSYADFEDAQAVRVREAIKSWFAWHRKTQLADYADLLLRIDAEVPNDTSAERVCHWWGAIRARIDRSVTRGVAGDGRGGPHPQAGAARAHRTALRESECGVS